MSRAQQIQVRSKRRQSWFSIDNEILDDYGEVIGHYGIAVYAALCRYANEDTQESTVGLTKLSKKLKIGRAKLLETLALLEQVELVSITPGDRKNTSVYTLLDVPKGGSNENHPRDEGGSEQNQGGSNENQGGGSDQNLYKTKDYKTTLQNEEGDNLSYLSTDHRDSVDTLLSIRTWDKDKVETVQLVADAMKTYPHVDVLGQATALAFKMRTGAVRKYKKPSTAFSNWVASEAAKSKQSREPEPVRIRSREL